MRTHIIIILILIISISLFSDANSNDNLSTGHRSNYSTINKYTNNFESANKITLGISVAITEFYLVDTEWHTLSWINVDKFNNNQYNHSVFTLVDFGLMFIASKFLPANYSRMSILNPVNLTNASHNIFPFGNPDYTKEKIRNGFNLAFFLKNSTNLYIFRKNKWIEVAPGAGIKLYYKNHAIDFGLERKFQMIEKRKPGYEDGFFFSLTGYIMN